MFCNQIQLSKPQLESPSSLQVLCPSSTPIPPPLFHMAKKHPTPPAESDGGQVQVPLPVKRKPGRPRKNPQNAEKPAQNATAKKQKAVGKTQAGPKAAAKLKKAIASGAASAEPDEDEADGEEEGEKPLTKVP